MKKKKIYVLSKQDKEELQSISNMLQEAVETVNQADKEGKETVDMSEYIEGMQKAHTILESILLCKEYYETLTYDW